MSSYKSVSVILLLGTTGGNGALGSEIFSEIEKKDMTFMAKFKRLDNYLTGERKGKKGESWGEIWQDDYLNYLALVKSY